MPPRANELFARKNLDFLLILEKKTTTTTTTNSEEKRKKKKKRKPRLRKLIRGTVKNPAPRARTKNQLRETKAC